MYTELSRTEPNIALHESNRIEFEILNGISNRIESNVLLFRLIEYD